MENKNENTTAAPAQETNVEKNAPGNKWKGASIILTVALAASLGSLGLYTWKVGIGPVAAANLLNGQASAKKAVDYINKYLIQSTTTQASLSQVSNTQNVLYKFTVDVKGQKIDTYVTSDGKMLFAQDPIDLTKSPEEPAEVKSEVDSMAQTDAAGSFKELTDMQVCQEDGKPIVYFFGSESCPHCKWEQPIINAVVKKFQSVISFHENINSDKDQDVFLKYNIENTVPTIIIGCKYYRIGTIESLGEEAETKALTELFCKVTNNQPGSACGK